MCRLSRNLGASTFWNPQGLYRPVMGYLYLYQIHYLNRVYFEKKKETMNGCFGWCSMWEDSSGNRKEYFQK
jgi:hypothetical protein